MGNKDAAFRCFTGTSHRGCSIVVTPKHTSPESEILSVYSVYSVVDQIRPLSVPCTALPKSAHPCTKSRAPYLALCAAHAPI